MKYLALSFLVMLPFISGCGKLTNEDALKAKAHYESGLEHINQGYTTFMDWRVRKDRGHFQKAENHFQTIIDSYSGTHYYELAHFYLGVIYAFESTYFEMGKADKSVKILEKLRTFTDDNKMQRLVEDMIVHVKSLEQAYMKSILAMDNVCSKIKTLADEVAAPK